MNKYFKEKCVICKIEIGEDDDIVVCPDCGAPQHKECYKNNLKCGCFELHEKNEYWVSDIPKMDQENTGSTEKSFECKNCKELNSDNNIFCYKCGSALKITNNAEVPLNHFYNIFDNFGGYSINDKIDGVSVEDISLYIGPNAGYFLSKFRNLYLHKGISWNFSVLFFDLLYFLYRKTYSVFLLYFLIMVLFVVINFGIYYYFKNDRILLFVNELLYLTIKVFIAAFFNKIYIKKCIKKIKKLRKTYSNNEEYKKVLSCRGGVSLFSILSAILILFIILFVGLLFLNFKI